jgi:hypothetical protein
MDVVVCDLDPVLHEAFLFSYKGTAPKKKARLEQARLEHKLHDNTSLDTLAPAQPDLVMVHGVMVHGVHMGLHSAESEVIFEASPPGNNHSSSVSEGATVMTNSPMPQSQAAGMPVQEALLATSSLNANIATNSAGKSPSGTSQTNNDRIPKWVNCTDDSEVWFWKKNLVLEKKKCPILAQTGKC